MNPCVSTISGFATVRETKEGVAVRRRGKWQRTGR